MQRSRDKSRARRGAGAAVAAALVAGSFAGPLTASAAWTAPTDISSAGQTAWYPEVVVDQDGDFLFMWSSSDHVKARGLSAAGVLDSVKNVSHSGLRVQHHHVSVDRDGDALIVWQRGDSAGERARVRPLSAAGALGTGQTMSGGGDSFGPHVAMAANGDAVLLWYASDGANTRLYARTRSAAGTLGAIQAVSEPGEDATFGRLDVNASGEAVFTWARFDGSDIVIQGRTMSAGGGLDPVETLSDPGEQAQAPDVALDDAGNAVFVWQRSDGSDYRVQARSRSAAGVLGAVRTLSDAGEPAMDPSVVLDAAGNAVFVWIRSDGSHFRVEARTMSSVGTLGLVSTLSDRGQDGTMPAVAVNDAGDAVITWQRFDGVDMRIEAATLSAAGQLGPTWTLSDAGGYAVTPEVAMHDGVAIVTWARDGRIQYAVGP
jgi:hypothetical protein